VDLAAGIGEPPSVAIATALPDNAHRTGSHEGEKMLLKGRDGGLEGG
jgi:hypothetical protein